MTVHDDARPDSSGSVNHTNVPSDTACIALIDSEAVEDAWEDLLYDGHDHDHAHGGLMMLPGAVGTHLSWGGRFPVSVFYNPYGFVTGFELDLDPYEEEMPHFAFDHDAEGADGWTNEVVVFMPSDTAYLADPSALEAAGGEGTELIELEWPSENGSVSVSVYSEGAVRKKMRVQWHEPVH